MTDHWNVIVDQTICVSSGMCAATAPQQLELDETGQGRAKSATTPVSDAVRDAAESCPVEAISIADAATGEQIFPPPLDSPAR